MKRLSLGEEFLIIFTEIKSKNKHRGSYLFRESKNSMEVRLFENGNRSFFFCGETDCESLMKRISCHSKTKNNLAK